MSHRRLVIPGLAFLVLVAGTVAHADVIEPYVESGPVDAYETACVSGMDHGPQSQPQRSYWLSTCAEQADYDGDGVDDTAFVTFSTHTCTSTADTWSCEYTYGFKYVDLAHVNIDLDAGTATWNAGFTDCQVAADIAATGDPVVGNPGPSGLSWPEPRFRDLSLHLGGVDARTSSDVEAAGTASVCGRTIDDDASGWMGRSSRERLAAGLRLKPEDTPMLGAAVERGEASHGRTSLDQACAAWERDNHAGHTFLLACGSLYDHQDDGVHDDAVVDVLRWTCDESTCAITWDETSVEPSEVTVDVDGGSAEFAATLDGCGSTGQVDLAFVDPGPIRPHHESIEGDALGADPATGRLHHGYRDDTWWRVRGMSLVPGYQVCGHPEAEMAPWSVALGDFQTERTYYYVGADPGALAP